MSVTCYIYHLDMQSRQMLIVLIARAQIQPNLIPSLKVIIPALSLICPIRVCSSMNVYIEGQNIYESLKEHLQNQTGKCSLNDTLTQILQTNKEKFRVCILGNQNVDWEVIMNYRRKKIIIDTAGSHPKYPQISFVTGGVNRKVTDYTMVKSFLNVFSLSSHIRHQFKIQVDPIVEFYVECKCCQPSKRLKNDFLSCSACLAIYCAIGDRQNKLRQCKVCNSRFDQ